MKLSPRLLCIASALHIALLFGYSEQSTFYNLDEIRDFSAASRQAVPLDQLFIRPLRHIKPKEHPLEYSFSGFIHHNAFWDSRQLFSAGQGDYLLYPLPYKPDIGGYDINAKGMFNMLNTETRLRAEARGPRIWDAHSFGVFEGDCWGIVGTQVANIVGLMRLRHAFMFFAWENLSLLIGQYWHPFFLPECFADTISFNGGSPMEPFEREPQVRLVGQYRGTQITWAAASYAVDDFAGALGTLNLYGRNAIMPDLNIDLQRTYRTHLFGITGNMHRIVPRLESEDHIKVHESLMSYGVQAYAKCIWDNFVLRAKAIYMQNGGHLVMLGGYAVSCIDPNTDQRGYANLSSVNFWIDAALKKGNFEPGCFLGYGKNVGATKPIDTNKIFVEGYSNIDYVFRVSPRLRYFADPLVVGAEFEYTRAAFGTLNCHGRVYDACPVGNIRFMSALFYCF